METPAHLLYEQRVSHSLTNSNSSYLDFIPPKKQMSGPEIVKQSFAASRLKSKLADGHVSLIDSIDNSAPLDSPIFILSMEAKPPIEIIDLCSPEPSITACSEKKTALAPITPTEFMDLDQSESEYSDRMTADEEEEEEDSVTKFRSEWIGTSQFCIEQSVEWQGNGTFDSLIKYHNAILYDLSQYPYDIHTHLEYAQLVNKLGFTDIGVATAHRAIILLEAFLNREPHLCGHVRDSLQARIQSSNAAYNPRMLKDEARTLHLQAYRHLLNGLLGCASFWDGLAVAKKALSMWPGDPELVETRQWLKEGFEDRHNGLKVFGANDGDLAVLTRMGKIYQKSYPWVPVDLYKRKPALVREVNKGFRASNCEVRPMVFGPPQSPSPSEQTTGTQNPEKQDVGPLGIFASRDIKEGELVMVDQSLMAVSSISPCKFEYCEACHATLKAPFIQTSQIVIPVCCKAVAYCSSTCYLTAMGENGGTSYHKVVCGKDFEWLYDATGSGVPAGAGYKWKKVMFLRIMAIIIADRNQEKLQRKKLTHPLQHHIIARMAANYASSDKLHPNMLNDWQYQENVVAPTRILMMLGINIFTDCDFSQETIQTIYWRIENNANMSIIDFTSTKSKITKSKSTSLSAELSNKNAVHMICLNQRYLFFNHSCEPNISWHGAIPNPHVGLDWIRGYKGEIMKVGSSAVFCKAFRDIKEGEELKISYVGDPNGEDMGGMNGRGREGKRSWLRKWFDGGCGCELCEREMREASTCGTDGGERMDIDLLGKLEAQI